VKHRNQATTWTDYASIQEGPDDECFADATFWSTIWHLLFREPDVGGISVSAHRVNDSGRHPQERFGWTEASGTWHDLMRRAGWDRGELSGGWFLGRRLTGYIETRSMWLFGAGASIQFKLKVILR
jgi:hypothetical protein